MRKITIEDISKQTGLSRGTVSRALNNRPDISSQTKQRVLEACQELNYVPSHAARSLATGKSYAVAVVLDDLRTCFSWAFLRGVLGAAQSEHYAVHVSELAQNTQAVLENLCSAANERVDSVLVAAALENDASGHLQRLLETRPVVATPGVEGLECDAFTPDFREAGRLVAQRVLQAPGHEALYVHDARTPAADSRLGGFQDACRERGVDPDAITVRLDGNAPDRFADVHARLGGVRAIGASDDYVAVQLMLLAAGAGRRPGEDLAVVGQGNEFVGIRVEPQLTTVDLCGEEIGRRAMTIAIQRISKVRQDAPQRTIVAPQLIERASTRNLQ